GGAEGMIGERATVIEACDPNGLVRVRGEVWKASVDAAEPLVAGERASVVAVEGLTVRVAKRER
ncbi:MAG TPA: NfeD family protein, partial [Solirubrobacterales bacterium]|nr:NfeD family protein [Solirubrobacterales bacterium]